MRRDSSCSVGLFALLLPLTAGAQVVKCTDAEGNVTYSDLPCLRSEKTTVVDTRAASNVADHSYIRAQKGRVWAPVSAPPVPVSYLSAPIAPASPSASTTSSDVSTVRPYSFSSY
jgi:uncharacterized protein DUF4124